MSQRRIVLSIDVEARGRILGEMPLLQHEVNDHVTYDSMILSIRSRSRLFRQPNHGQEPFHLVRMTLHRHQSNGPG